MTDTPPSLDQIDQTYDALIRIVQTTCVTKHVLTRPPFTFLHKLLVELLGGYNIFTANQLKFNALTTTEAKVGFLIRCMAFVSNCMKHHNTRRVSCYFHISPVNILAGLAVSDTLQFLQQLCEICRQPLKEAKAEAAKFVCETGDAILFAAAVKYRKAIQLIQAVVLLFILRRRKFRQYSIIQEASGKLYYNAHKQVGSVIFKLGPQSEILYGIITAIRGSDYEIWYQKQGITEHVDEQELDIRLQESNQLVCTKLDPALSNRNVEYTQLPQLRRTTTYKDVDSQDENNKLGNPLSNNSDSTETKEYQWQKSLKESLQMGRTGSNEKDQHKGILISNGGVLSELKQKDFRRASLSFDCVTDLPNVPSLPKIQITRGNSQKFKVKRQTLPAVVVPSNNVDTKSTPEIISPPKTAAADVTCKENDNPQTIHQHILPISVPNNPNFNTSYGNLAIDREELAKLTLFRDVARRIEAYIKRKRLRIIDMFRFCDMDGSGTISSEEMLETLGLMDIHLTKDAALSFINHIDRDGNGEIDVYEFEELLRACRRNDAQITQVKNGLQYGHSTESYGGSFMVDNQVSSDTGGIPALVKQKEQICQVFKGLDVDFIQEAQLQSYLKQLNIPGVNDDTIRYFMNLVLAHTRCDTFDSLRSTALKSSYLSPQSASLINASHGAENNQSEGQITLQHLNKVFFYLATKKTNKYLDHAWLNQFDSQLDRIMKEADLL